jgi:hypothetical protein
LTKGHSAILWILQPPASAGLAFQEQAQPHFDDFGRGAGTGLVERLLQQLRIEVQRRPHSNEYAEDVRDLQ